MHPTDKKQSFIERRAAGHTLTAIAKDLQLPKTTIWRWDQDEQEHIYQLQTMYQEEAEKTWHQNRLQRLVDLQTCGDWLHEALVEKLGERAQNLCLKEIFLYMNLLRSEMDHYRLKPLPPRSNPDPDGSGTSRPQPLEPLPPRANPGATTKTEQNGTMNPENGTPSDGERPSRGQNLPPTQHPTNSPEPAANESLAPKTEQNETPNPENGTPPSESGRLGRRNDQTIERSDQNSRNVLPLPTPHVKTEQNGTELPENGTPSEGERPSRGQNLPPTQHPTNSPEPAANPNFLLKTEQNGTTNPENGMPSSPTAIASQLTSPAALNELNIPSQIQPNLLQNHAPEPSSPTT